MSPEKQYAKDSLASLRRRIEKLENAPRRFGRTLSISEAIDAALPGGGLPLGCVHEVQGSRLACAAAFAAILAGRILRKGGQAVWVGPERCWHLPGLLPYGLTPEKLVYVWARRAEDQAWAALEALRCRQVGAVLATIRQADLTLCRRWQLAAEESGATAFLLGTKSASAITRWHIHSVRTPRGVELDEACWRVDLAYCRGGQPAQWLTRWRGGQLELLAARPPQRAEAQTQQALAG